MILNREFARVTTLEEKDRRIAELEANSTAIIELPARSGSHHLAEYFRDASAGSGIFILGNEAASQISIPEASWDPRTDYVIRVNGNSMEPDYMDGDNVMVSQRVEMNYGDVGIFVVNGKAFIKEYGETELISRNPDSHNIPVHEGDNIVCMGKVIGKLGPDYEIISD
ncbi:MAG: S24 family peptidase [Butyrivibrio sp.]|nr:S24 family peptidase [Acetatifactor muris]MCM1560928.1 S24 family peptidase [Butyrivibrio sp.]